MNATPRRLALTGLTTLTLVVASPAAAFATDDGSAGVFYKSTATYADDAGASGQVRKAFVGDDGRAYYREVVYWADWNGSGVERVVSRAG